MGAAHIARTALGDLQGDAADGIVTFRGVRYAAPPIGDLRFAAPEAISAWSGLRDATRDGPIAPQPPSRLRAAMGDYVSPQDEDCLTLTIWTPAADAATRPVMVFLHGGAWSSGAGSLAWYAGSTLARDNGVVVVGVNYRLGALGYLHCPGISPGNLGTLDQIVALRFVRDNIAAFGGDPANVTVAGQSAGAASIGRLIMDPAARPLFRRAIIQSGGFGRGPLTNADAAEIGGEFVRFLGVDPESSGALSAIRSVSTEKLLQAHGRLARSRARFADTTPAFMPIAETPMTSAELIGGIARAAHGLDVIIGATRDEVHAFFAGNPDMADPAEDAVAERFAALAGHEDAIELYRARRPGGSRMDLLADLMSDHVFGWPSMRLADALSASGVRVFAYQFAWAPPSSRFKACHCIELPFMFGTLDAWPDAAMLAGGDMQEMQALSVTMRRAWSSFMHDGDPGHCSLPWTAYDADRRATLVFDSVSGMMGDPFGLGWRA